MNQQSLKGQNPFRPGAMHLKRPQPKPLQGAPTGTNGASGQSLAIQTKIRDLSVKLEQMRAKLRVIEDKRTKTLAPAYRQTADQQIAQLKAQIQPVFQELHLAKSQERALFLNALVKQLQSIRDKLAPLRENGSDALPDFSEIESEMASITLKLKEKYTADRVFPTEKAQIFMRSFVGAFIQKSQCFVYQTQAPFAQAQAKIQSMHQDLGQFPFVIGEEKQGLKALNQGLDQIGQTYFALLERQAPAVDSATTQAPPSDAQSEIQAAQASLAAMKDKVGDLEVKFDFAAGKSVVQNQLGVSVNQAKKTYQAYLDEGFGCIDQVVASEFTQMAPFQQAIEAFLEAISLKKERHEAYFGLGYLYSLVRDINHSIYFLDIAYKISSSPSIKEFIHKVKASYGLT